MTPQHSGPFYLVLDDARHRLRVSSGHAQIMPDVFFMFGSFMAAGVPQQIEAERLEALRRYEPHLGQWSHIAQLAALAFDVAQVGVTVVGEDWIETVYGIGLPLQKVERDKTFCSTGILSDEVLVVHDAHEVLREDLAAHLWHVGFYAGVPIVTPDGHRLGMLFVLDAKARDWFGERERNILWELGQLASQELERCQHRNDRHQASSVELDERQRLTAKMMEIDRMVAMGLLALGMGHEINNPLTYAKANLDYALRMLTMRYESPIESGEFKSLGEALTDACEGMVQIRGIVNELKRYARAGGGLPVEQGAVDVKPMLESAINMAWSEIGPRARIKRHFDLVPPVRGDATRLRQIFLNLLVNAAQAIPIGSRDDHEIKAMLSSANGRVIVEIADTGVGIAPEELPRLFEPFFTTKAKEDGTGLGLAICRNIVDSLGGEIEVESTVGLGTTFRVILPAAAATLPPLT